MKNDLVYLQHIQEAVLKIEKYVEGLEEDGFIEDGKTFDAVVRQLQIIGEATKRLSGEFKQERKLVPWDAIVGFRNKAVHEYFDLNAMTIWETVKYDLPELTKMLGLKDLTQTPNLPSPTSNL